MFIFIILVLVITIYYLIQSKYQYWEKRGVSGPKPKFLVGNLGRFFLMKGMPPEIYAEIYDKYEGYQIVGAYRSITPVLIIRDAELIKEVTIKSFNHFHDNDMQFDKKAEPILGRNPLVLKGEEWKAVRSLLTPGFTSGKMKWIYPHLQETCSDMVRFIEKQKGALNGEGYEAKELCTKYTLNNVASCAFGLEAKCFEEETSEFRDIAKEFLSPGGWALTVFSLATVFPSLMKMFSVRFTPRNVEKRLINIVSKTLKYREENNVVRNDFLHILSQLRKTCKDFEFTDVDVVAHASSFFLDGYETTSMVMSYLLLELASNSDIQSKLREEICRAFEDNNDKLPYEALQDISYLDACFYESMRLHPIIYALQRICTKPYTFTLKDSKQVSVEKGTPVILPVYGLHKDPEYFEDPESFNPERFMGANKENIVKGSFLPFGEGPRACLGQRFGILQVKIGVAYVMKNYILSVNKRTQLPLKNDPLNVLVTPLGGLWLDFKKI